MPVVGRFTHVVPNLRVRPHIVAAPDRVSEAIRALGYRRNEAARALKTRQTMNIGVLAHNTTLYGPASTLNGVERAAHQAGYATTLARWNRRRAGRWSRHSTNCSPGRWTAW